MSSHASAEPPVEAVRLGVDDGEKIAPREQVERALHLTHDCLAGRHCASFPALISCAWVVSPRGQKIRLVRSVRVASFVSSGERVVAQTSDLDWIGLDWSVVREASVLVRCHNQG